MKERKKGKGQKIKESENAPPDKTPNSLDTTTKYAYLLPVIFALMESPFSRRVNEPLQVDKASVSQRCGPERLLNTSGMELVTGFAQEDLTIYDRRDKTEVERDRVLVTVASCINSMLCVDNCKCTTGAMQPHPSYSYSNLHWNTQRRFSWH